MQKLKIDLLSSQPRNGLFSYYANGDCIEIARKYIPDNFIDLIISDPPYGIEAKKLHKHYNRNENLVIQGYVEIEKERYKEFSVTWIKEAERVLKPGGALYIFSGWTNLTDILNALNQTDLVLVNHIIWKYNFGVYTRTKYVTSHYHILYFVKKGGKPTFNTFSRYSPTDKFNHNRSSLYDDLEDVWFIKRRYKNGKIKNKNELPEELIIKILQYSSNEGDIVGDFFAGSFITAKMAKALNRNNICIEVNPYACQHEVPNVKNIQWGENTNKVLNGKDNRPKNEMKPWTPDLINEVEELYKKHRMEGLTKKDAINRIQSEFGRGYFSILNVLKRVNL